MNFVQFYFTIKIFEQIKFNEFCSYSSTIIFSLFLRSIAYFFFWNKMRDGRKEKVIFIWVCVKSNTHKGESIAFNYICMLIFLMSILASILFHTLKKLCLPQLIYSTLEWANDHFLNHKEIIPYLSPTYLYLLLCHFLFFFLVNNKAAVTPLVDKSAAY